MRVEQIRDGGGPLKTGGRRRSLVNGLRSLPSLLAARRIRGRKKGGKKYHNHKNRQKEGKRGKDMRSINSFLFLFLFTGLVSFRFWITHE